MSNHHLILEAYWGFLYTNVLIPNVLTAVNEHLGLEKLFSLPSDAFILAGHSYRSNEKRGSRQRLFWSDGWNLYFYWNAIDKLSPRRTILWEIIFLLSNFVEKIIRNFFEIEIYLSNLLQHYLWKFEKHFSLRQSNKQQNLFLQSHSKSFRIKRKDFFSLVQCHSQYFSATNQMLHDMAWN